MIVVETVEIKKAFQNLVGIKTQWNYFHNNHSEIYFHFTKFLFSLQLSASEIIGFRLAKSRIIMLSVVKAFSRSILTRSLNFDFSSLVLLEMFRENEFLTSLGYQTAQKQMFIISKAITFPFMFSRLFVAYFCHNILVINLGCFVI